MNILYWIAALLPVWAILVAPGWTQAPPADQWLARPVEDRTFKTYQEFFVYDRHAPFDLQVIDVKEQEGIRREHLSFQSTPGIRVFANLYRLLPVATQQGPAVILLHGGSSEGKDAAATKVIATLLTRAGWNVLAMDMQYWSDRSTGLMTTFSEKEKHERLYNVPSVYLAWVAQTVKDVSRSLDLLVEHRNADPRRIVMVGFSRGATVGTIIGVAESRLAAIVLLYGTHFDALEREHLPAACPANYIGRISPRPILMINGLLDTDHLKEQVKPLYCLAREPKKILWANTGHQLPTEEHRAAMLQ